MRPLIASRLLSIVTGMMLLSCSDAFSVEKLKFSMGWLPQGNVGGVLVAIGKGYFKEVGLDVEAMRGYGGQRTVNEADQGLFDIGNGDPISVVLNRANGGDTTMIGAINTQWPGGLCYLNSAGRKFSRLQELKGMTLGGGPASPVRNILPAWLVMNHLPKDYIKLLQLDPAVIDASLVEGRIDLSECWAGANKPLLKAKARAADKTIDWIPYRDYGLDIYGNGFVTTGKMVRERPDTLRKFLAVSYRGFQFMKDNAAEATTVIAAQFPMLNREVLHEQIEQTNDLIVDPTAGDRRPGFQREDRMKHTLSFVQSAFKLSTPVDLKDLYTNALLN